MGEKRGAHMVFMAKPEGKRPFGRPGYRWEVNIKIDLQEMNDAWTELIRHRKRTSGGFLYTQ
jgi:hypothetical protein